jgi:predicted GNAT family acetyltransferase
MTAEGMEQGMSEIRVEHRPERRRFALLDGETTIGAAHYRELETAGGIERVFFHTVVDEAYAGQGLAGKLAAAALSGTVEEGHKIVPVCPYIKVYVTKHHEYDADLVKPTPEHLAILPTA